ncbi:MAG: hypothetical protein GX100_07685 [candidate division WS1 bacterium]|nr:hypothetical protein [candidate division WS1 bacterium]
MSLSVRGWLALSALCLLGGLAAKAEEAPAQPASPEATVSRLLEYFRGSAVGRYRGGNLGELLAPGSEQTQLRQWYSYLAAYALVAAGRAPETQITGDTAKVVVPAQPLTVMLKQIEGKWLMDLPATLAAMPEATQNTMKAQQCMGALWRLASAVRQYADKHEGALPSAETWRDDLAEALGGAEAMRSVRCPLASPGVSGFAMNEALSGKSLKSIDRPEATVLFFESDREGPNPCGGEEALAAPRHEGGNYYVMANLQVRYNQAPPSFTYVQKAPPPVNAGGPPPQ